MNQTMFIPNELNFKLLNLDHNSTYVDFHAISNQISSQCPLCLFTATKVHSKYIRMNGDLPISNKTVKLKHYVRKFFCESTNYIRKFLTRDSNTISTLMEEDLNGLTSNYHQWD
jgi:hypothetical protein